MYVFDPATPRPVAVQSNVSKKADVMSATFDPGYLSCSSTKDHPIKMSKLYYLNHNQVSLLCLVYCFNHCKRKGSQDASRCFKKLHYRYQRPPGSSPFLSSFCPCFSTNLRSKPFIWKWVCFALIKALVGGTRYMDDVAGRLVFRFPRNGQLTSCDKTFDILF